MLTREYPPHVYGGAGVHVDFLTRELRRLVEDAGSIRKLADGDNSFVGVISNVLQGKRPITNPQVLDLLGLEVVFRLKGRS